MSQFHSDGFLISTVFAALLGICGLSGCSPTAEPLNDRTVRPSSGPADDTNSVEYSRPLQAMQAAVDSGNWNLAATHLDAVLISHPSDAAALELAAQVAYQTGRPDQAADLLTDAVAATEFSDTTLAQRAVIGLIGVGRLMDGIELLDKVVARSPDQTVLRRLLFDLRMGVDDRSLAILDGRALVKQRSFDADLLLMLDIGARRKEENQSFESMVQRHPSDLRPLTGKAMTQMDHGDLEQALETANRIVDAHPSWRPARWIQGRALVQLRRTDELVAWFENSTAADTESPWYWMVLGDWHRDGGQLDDSIACYWQSIQREPGLLQAWQKLGSALQELASLSERIDQATLQVVSNGVDRLSRIRQDKENFLFQGKTSPELAIEIAKGLEEFGRLWEAEAWSAIAMTLPGNKTRVDQYRQNLVKRLRKETPWDTIDPPLFGLPALAAFRTPDTVPSDAVPSAEEDFFGPFISVPSFRDEASQRGLTFFGKTSDRMDQPGLLLYATAGCGLGAIDFDLDGWPDIYCANAGGMPGQRNSRPNSLWRNQDGLFTDVTGPSESGDRGFGQGICVGDLNEDGFPDLWLANYGPNRVLINNGDGTFQDVSEQWCVDDDPRWTTSAAIADLNGDGLADVWEVNYCAGMEATTTPCASKPEGPPSSVCAPIVFQADLDRVYSVKPTGGLADVTTQWCDPPSVPGRGLGIVVGAIDPHVGLDVLVANDMTNNHLWLNENSTPTRFQEAGVMRGLAADGRSQPQGSMGIATGDFDHDGRTDIYVTSFEAEYNTFHRQSRTSGFWSDSTGPLGLAQSTIKMVGFGTQAVDMDNDGNQELFVSNGHIDPVLDYAQPAQIFQRTTANAFKLLDLSLFEGYLAGKHVGRAVSSIDINRDGWMDLAITHQTEPVAVLVNQTESSNHWIRFTLIGREDARDAIGTEVSVRVGERTLHASKFSGGGYMNSNQPCVHFGLADHRDPVQVHIRWPGGGEEDHEGLSVDREWVLVQGLEPF